MSAIGEPQRIIIVEPLAEPVPKQLPEMPVEPTEVPELEPVEVSNAGRVLRNC